MVKKLLPKYGRIPAVPYIIWILATAYWMFAAVAMPVHFIRAAFSLLFLLLVPGYFAYRSIAGKIPTQPLIKTLSYSVGLSLLLIMLSGLGLNQVAGAFNYTRPLTTLNLSLVIGGVTALLITVSQIRQPMRLWRPKLNRKRLAANSAVAALCALLPLLAIGGANTLNNGGGNWLAMTVIGLIAATIAAVSFQKNRLNIYLPYILYSLTLSIMLGVSMRGWNITGHDIIQEFQVFQLTLQHAAWNMHYYQDAYNACLSITILPTVLQQLTGISDPYIYKFAFQLFNALLAPMLYQTLRPYVARKTAFLAAIVFVTFPTFITDITMLNRQEVALLSLMLAIQAALDRKLSRSARSVLSFLFLTAMILSHYSTSYVSISILLACIVIGAGLHLLAFTFHKLPKPTTAFAIFRPAVVIAALMVLLMWNTFATQTSNNIAATFKGIGHSLPLLLSGKGLDSNNSKIGGTGTGVITNYAAEQTAKRTLMDIEYYPNVASKYPVREQKDTNTPENSVLRKAGVPVSGLTSFYDFIKSAYAAILVGLIVVGLAVVSLRRRSSQQLPLQYTLLGVASLLIVGLQVVLPSDVINYGLLRVLQQALIVLALPIVLGAFWLMGLVRIPAAWRSRILGIALAVFFLILSGFVSAITGGDKPALPLANKGFYYEAYLTHQDEITADTWLHDKTPTGSRVYADEFARRKMITYGGIFAQPTLVPSAIPIDSYVYISSGNTSFNSVPVYYKGQLAFYSVPYKFLNANKNLVYSAGDIKIYK